MSIETNPPVPSAISFQQSHTLALRLWHWLTVLGMTASLVTVLLASTMFRTRNNIDMVQQQLQEKGVVVSKDQARAVAHEYSDKLWDTHKLIGYVLCFLLLSRVIIEIAQPGPEKFRSKLVHAMKFQSNIGSEQQERKHFLMVKRIYLVFYLAILIMALTGLGLAFEDAPYLKDMQKSFKSIHSFVQYFIYGFIFFHLAGLLLAETGKHRGIVSGMIHGRKG